MSLGGDGASINPEYDVRASWRLLPALLAPALALLTGIAPAAVAQKASAAGNPDSAAARGPKLLPPVAQRAQRLQSVKSWGYQLKRLRVDEVAASPYDLVVIDYAPDRVAGIETPFSPRDVADMQRRPDGGKRLVLAYLSIGEAEWYRTYWKGEWLREPKAPWLGDMNPRWFGNFPVQYWHGHWQAIIFGTPQAYLDRIVAAGFDGVYLDRADIYQEWEKKLPDAERLMADFLTRLSAHARKLSPHFLVVMQNAEELLSRRDVRQAIDGIAKEDLFYGVNHDETENPQDGVVWSLDHLRLARRAGKAVLVVEYLSDPSKAADARRRAIANGFLPYLATRDLGAFVIEPPDRPRSTPQSGPAAPNLPQRTRGDG